MALQPFRGFYHPRREMERLRREMNRLFSGMSEETATAPGYPAMNVWTNEDGAIVTAELPGVNVDDIDISIVSDTLTLSGNRPLPEVPEDATFHRHERPHGRFSRVFRLPFPIDAEQVDASFENGVLSITLPRPESDKPKKISIKTGQA